MSSSLSAVATGTTAAPSDTGSTKRDGDATPTSQLQPTDTAVPVDYGYSYSSSTIVRVAIAAGIIVVVICALLLALKISTWIRYRQRLSRQRALWAIQDNERKARAFELAAWADTPGQAPVERENDGPKPAWWRRRHVSPADKAEKDKHKRGRTNAYAVYEWEGTPA